MASYFTTPKHSKSVMERRAKEEGVLGIQPDQTDSPRLKAFVAGALAVAVVAVGGGVAYAAWPESRVDVFEGYDLPFIDGKKVDCTYLLENYQPDDFTDTMIAGGATPIYSGSDAQEGVKFYRDHMDAAVVGGCDAYVRDHKGTPAHEQFIVRTSTEPVVGEHSSFRIIIGLEPTGHIAG
jgi:hypothetical protein